MKKQKQAACDHAANQLQQLDYCPTCGKKVSRDTPPERPEELRAPVEAPVVEFSHGLPLTRRQWMELQGIDCAD